MSSSVLEISGTYFLPISRDVSRREVPGVIRRIKSTTSEAIRQYSQFGKMAVMSFANPFSPGSWIPGFPTQEDRLLSLTPDAHDRLKENKDLYPLFRSNRSLYLPNVTLSLNEDSTTNKKPLTYTMLVAPPIRMNSKRVREELETYSYTELVNYYMKPKLHNLLVQCVNDGVLTVILGLWGLEEDFAPRTKSERQAYVTAVMRMMTEVSKKFLPFLKQIVITE